MDLDKATSAPHNHEPEEIVGLLNTNSVQGLTPEEAGSRLKSLGPNILPAAPVESPWQTFFRQFRSLLVIILLAAALLSFTIWVIEREEYLPFDTIVIMAIVSANAALGFFQEYRAERSLEKLVALSGPEATVIRGGTRLNIDAKELVPGDIMIVSTGDKISADARLLSETSLETDESPLTGESTPVAKSAEAVPEDAPVADRHCMIFSGTAITFGQGLAVVTSTGGHTEVGRIAELIQEAPQKETPLQKSLDQLGRKLAIIVLVIATIVAIAGFLATGVNDLEHAVQMLLFGVALAVAAIPEGLPAVVTGALALGTQRMAARKAIVRRLPAVETLGSTTAICSDKTGTLTVGEMTVREISVPGGKLTVEGGGYAPGGRVSGPPGALAAAEQLARGAVLCNDSSVMQIESGQWQPVGSHTEAALVTLAAKLDVEAADLRKQKPRLAEAAFTSERKKMSVVVQEDEDTVIYTKGAPERVIELCTHIMTGQGAVPIGNEQKEALLDAASDMASRALRTLSVARGRAQQDKSDDAEACENNLVYLGTVGIADPPRPEARAAIGECHQAGIDVFMLTGDHLITANAIAAELGISGDSMTGNEIDNASDEELARRMETVRIFARVSPKHKVRVVAALQEDRHTVAVTGDGVNDAPALKHADIGVAMGITGTDVSREAADMVLADDNFATIVAAVEEGRAIFSNIRRFVTFLLAANAGEILTLFAGVLLAGLLGLKPGGTLLLPLLAVQILWINLVTDGLPALALGIEAKHPQAMNRPPRPRGEQVMIRLVWERILVVGLISSAGTLLLLDSYLPGGVLTLFEGHDITYARTMAFVTLALFQMYYAFSCRFMVHNSLPHLFGNKWLNLAVISSVLMMVAVVHIPGLQHAFYTAPLSIRDWLIAFTVGSLSLWSIEILKLATRSRELADNAIH